MAIVQGDFSVADAEREARAELRAEAQRKAKDAFKGKLKALAAARAVVANLERELEALKLEVASDVSDLG